jgi:hypothetical protein
MSLLVKGVDRLHLDLPYPLNGTTVVTGALWAIRRRCSQQNLATEADSVLPLTTIQTRGASDCIVTRWSMIRFNAIRRAGKDLDMVFMSFV